MDGMNRIVACQAVDVLDEEALQACRMGDRPGLRADLDEEVLEVGLASPKATFDVGVFTSRGLGRADNQDALLVEPLPGSRGILAGVFDGVGGQAGGGAASVTAALTLAVDALHVTLHEDRARARLRLDAWLLQAMLLAHREVCAVSRRNKTRGLTTASVLVTDGREVHVAHVGDSRVYRSRAGVLSQLTTDHTMVEADARYRMRDGTVSREEAVRQATRAARENGTAHTILESFGGESTPQVDLTTAEACPGDVFLLSSDGLHGAVDDRVLGEVLASEKGGSDLARDLVAAAYAAPSDDNVSVLVLKVGAAPRPRPDRRGGR